MVVLTGLVIPTLVSAGFVFGAPQAMQPNTTFLLHSNVLMFSDSTSELMKICFTNQFSLPC